MTAIQMDEGVYKFHMDVLSMHSTKLFSSLINQNHIISDNLKEIEFEGLDELKRGYMAKKDRQKYWISEGTYPTLPIRINEYEELKLKDDIIFNPTDASTFNILPEQMYPVREMVDSFVPFRHSHPDQWFIAKMVALVSYIGKTFVCIASEPAFGKTSIFNVLHSITDKSPVFKPRSVPGVLNKINTSGSIVFDEAHESAKDTRDIMEEFTLTIGGGSTVYVNGAMKSHNTKSKYDCHLQSIIFLYNNVGCYKDPEKKYFEVIFSNNKAMDDRLLKLKLDGVMTQPFTRDFDITQVAEDNRMYYINLAKTLLWLQEYKLTGDYDRKWVQSNILKLKGRQKIIYDEITWLLDMYCDSQVEYDKHIGILNTAITNYNDMIQVFKDFDHNPEPTETEDIQ